jgi:hypothetical protein
MKRILLPLVALLFAITVFAQTPTLISTGMLPSYPSIVQGATVQLFPSAGYSDGSVQRLNNATWTSSAPNIATVSSTGMVTGVALGKATITAIENGVVASAVVTVANPTPTPSPSAMPTPSGTPT